MSFRYTYDADHGRCVRTVGDGGIYDTELHFDFAKRNTMTSGNQEPRKYTWNAEGLVLREETLGGEWARERTYDADHYLLSEANAAGEKVKLVHDARGNLIQRVDPAGNTTAWEIQDDRPAVRIDPDGNETTYQHDGHGALIGVTYPTGQRFSLDTTAEAGSPPSTATMGSSPRSSTTPSTTSCRRPTRAVRSRNTGTTRSGDPIARRDALGRVTRVRVRPPFAPDRDPPLGRHHDAGRVRCARAGQRFTDAAGKTTRLEYAGLHALVKLIEPTEQEWQFQYDELERLRRITNPQREEFYFQFDDAGQLVEETSFHGRTLRYTYNLAENLSRIDYPGGTFRTFRYDPLRNVVRDDSPHGSIAFERDKRGMLKQAVLTEYNGKVVTAFERDDFGRVIKETQNGRAITFEHDAQGRRLARTLPNGATTHYYRDPLGAFAGVDHDGHKVSIQRDVLGRDVRRHVYQGGVDILRAYDAMGRSSTSR